MAVYTIIRVFEVPAETKQQAADRMIEAMILHTEKDYHVRDLIREPGAKHGKVVDLYSASGWLELVKKQIAPSEK